MSTNTLVICSGGLDSITLAYKLHSENKLNRLVSFDYGQRHKKELDFAQTCANDLNVPWHCIDLSAVGAQLQGSALTDDIDVPDGHYAEDNMKVTIVPNRNAIMLTIAYGVAISHQCNSVATAVHGGDHFIYPDCRQGFLDAFSNMQQHAIEGVANIDLCTPYSTLTKVDIARDSHKYQVPIGKTWSCYKGEDLHCGRCGTCIERIEAFQLAKVKDTTVYSDNEYWKTVLNT